VDIKSFYRTLEEFMELPAQSLQGDEELSSLEGWDSMAVLNVISYVDETYGRTLDPEAIAKCAHLADLAQLIDCTIAN